MRKIKRIILITVDCLRADMVGCIGGGNLTPKIDKLSRDSIIFTKAFANGPGTNQSFPSILTSTYFLMHEGMRLNTYCTSISEVLSKHGFKSVAFHSNPFLSKNLGWNKGFQEFYDFMDIIKSPSAVVARRQKSFSNKIVRAIGSIIGAKYNSKVQFFLKKIYYKFSNFTIPYIEGKMLNQKVINWINKNQDRKFFIWMHYMDPHYPYIPPEEFSSIFSDRKEAFQYNLSVNYNNPSQEEVETLKKLYKDEIRYTDACIGNFFYFLEERGLLDDSLIFLTADHGHAFMEHGRFGHAYDILYNEVLHVPLLIYGLEERSKIEANVQLLDISPTILEIMNIKKPSTFLGGNLLNAENLSREIFSESAKPDLINLRYNLEKKVISCIRDKYKIILNELLGTVELYDLDTDFGERNNRFKEGEKLSSEMLSLIKRHLLQVKSFKTKLKIRTFK